MSTPETDRDVAELATLLDGLFARPMAKEIAPRLADLAERMERMELALTPISELPDLAENQINQARVTRLIQERLASLEQIASTDQAHGAAFEAKLAISMDALHREAETLRSGLTDLDQAVATLRDEHRAFAKDIDDRLNGANALAAEQFEMGRLARARQTRVAAIVIASSSALTTALMLLVSIIFGFGR